MKYLGNNLLKITIKKKVFINAKEKKWEIFTPDRRFNVDLVPMLFVIDYKTTYEVNVEKEVRRNHCVWVANPGPGLEKRQCTRQTWIFAESKVRIGIIFRETGKRVSGAEIKA